MHLVFTVQCYYIDLSTIQHCNSANICKHTTTRQPSPHHLKCTWCTGLYCNALWCTWCFMVHLVHQTSTTSARVQCFMLQQTQCIVINLGTTPQTFANVLKINIKYVVQNVRYVLFCTQDCVAVKWNAMKCDSLHCSQM